MPLKDWIEYKPAYYTKEFTPEQIERLSRRPDDLIRRALEAALSRNVTPDPK